MKKNISINISGIIFHIEEDGYDKLKEYLDTIHRYFSSYDDSSEIIADIENRIAEIFLGKLKDGKQVITFEDVEALMATMGGIKDFKEVEVDEEPEPEAEAASTGAQGSYSDTGSRKLYRDEKRKILGGVLSGIAYYFTVDPLWIRLIYIVMFFGVSFLPAIPALLTIAYIVLWIIVPGTWDLEEQKKVKKMFRDPDDKVLGGVASGIAAYFGVDRVIIRLLFVILVIFGGTGLILYIILWIILPEARTITDKMEMQGEPVTLRNIETNIKKGLKMDESDEESAITKILLFPFRLIAAVINFLSKALGPVAIFLVEAVRVIFGLILVFTAIGLTLALIISFGVAVGVLSGTYLVDYVDFPIALIQQDISVWVLIAGFFVGLIPNVFLVILGISIISKRVLLNAKVGWGLFALWLIGLLVVIFTVPPIIGLYGRNGVHTEVENYNIPGKTVVLNLKQTGLEDYEVTTLKLRGHEDSVFRLEKRFEARGKTRMDAIENAKMITYNVTLDDSVFTFDSNIQFKDNARFRGQKLDMILYLPYNRPFQMDEDLRYIIRNTIYYHGFRVSQMEGNTWEFTDDGLKCLTCPADDDVGVIERDNDDQFFGDSRSYDLSGFKEVSIGSIFNAEIIGSQNWDVSVSGRDSDLEDVRVNMTGSELDIDFNRDISRWDRDRKEVKVRITMPLLERIELSGAAKGYIQGFSQERMEFDLTGAATSEAEVDLVDAEVDLNGASKLSLYGKALNLRADINGASSLDASDFETDYTDIEVSGASRARVFALRELNIDASGGSVIRYKGDPVVTSNRSSGSSIVKE